MKSSTRVSMTTRLLDESHTARRMPSSPAEITRTEGDIMQTFSVTTFSFNFPKGAVTDSNADKSLTSVSRGQRKKG